MGGHRPAICERIIHNRASMRGTPRQRETERTPGGRTPIAPRYGRSRNSSGIATRFAQEISEWSAPG